MGQDKKQLTKLLAFVKEIYDHPDNKEFAEGIREMVLSDKDFQERLKEIVPGADPESLKRIEKYLALDFEIDEKIFPDYSVIQDEQARTQLTSDFREMLRYQYGTRSHKIDFAEFCRYAHLQAEMLVNYYFEKKFGGDIDQIVAAIQAYLPKYKPYEGLTEVSGIAFKTKLYYLRNIFKWSANDINIYLHTADVRNKQSHRSLMADKDLIRETEDKLKAAGAWNANLGAPVFKKNEEGVSVAVAVVGQDILNEYNFQVWYDKQPFGSIISGLKRLLDKVASSI